MKHLARIVAWQYEEAWSMLGEAIAAVEEPGWRSGDSAYAVPARLAYHAIETADYYMHPDLAGFEWAGRFGVDWKVEDFRALPGKDDILEYLDAVRTKVEQLLEARSDMGLLAPDEVFHQEGMTHLDRALYVLRHTHQHLGELCSILRSRSIPRPGWR